MKAATGIIYGLESAAGGLVFKAGHVVDVLDEAIKDLDWGKGHITNIHGQAEGPIQDNSAHVCIHRPRAMLCANYRG